MNWLSKLATAEDYLRSLNANPDIVQWIMNLEEEDRQWYINEVRKNPGINLFDLQKTIPPFTPKSEITPQEQEIAMDFANDTLLYNWIKVQLRKLRKGKAHIGSARQLWYDYSIPIDEVHPNLYLIDDWYNDLDYNQGKHPELASYTYEQALDEAIKYNQKPKVDLEYDNSQVPLYSPPEWGGWSIVAMTSQNDLDVEGEKMSHCSGSYCEDVYAGAMYLLSLRDPQNNPHVTIQIMKDGAVTQIHGYGNSEPKPEYKQKIKDFLAQGQDELFKFTGKKLNLHTRRDTNLSVQSILDLDIPNMAARIREIISMSEYGLPYDLDHIAPRMDRMYKSISSDIIETYTRRLSIQKDQTRLIDDDYNEIKDLGYALAELAYTIDQRYEYITDLDTGEQIPTNAALSLIDTVDYTKKYLNHAIRKIDSSITYITSIFNDSILSKIKELKGDMSKAEYR